MRILTVDRHPSSANGGQEWSLLEECVGLARKGHDVTLGYVTEGDFLDRHRAAGVKTVKMSGVELVPSAYPSSAARFGRSALRSRGVPADVVCMNQYHDALFGRAVTVGRDVPLVCHLRLLPPVAPCRQWRLGLSGVDRFIAASRCVHDAWMEAALVYGATVDVVYDGIDTRRFRPLDDRQRVRAALGAPPDSFVVAYAGRIDRMKNLDRVLEAVASLRLPVDKLRVWIAGRPVDHASPEAGGAYVNSLRQLAASLGIGSAIRWLGPRSDIPDLLGAADAAVLFSDAEGFGRATVEALACGTPIVANRAGATAEILTGEFSRFAFDLGQPDEPVELLRSCIGLSERDPGFAARAYQHVVDNFSTAAMVDGIERSLQSVVAVRTA